MLLSLAIGYGVGAATRGLRVEFSGPVGFRVGACCYEVFVPIQYWRTASTARPPTISSPWGESFEPTLYPLSRWTEIAVYNPYDAPFGSSADLVALQIGRAVEAVTGRHVAHETIRDRFLRTEADGRVVLRQPLTFADELPHRRDLAPRGQFPVTLAIVGVPWLLMAAVAFRSRRRSGRRSSALFVGVFGSIVLAGVALLVADARDIFEHWVASWWLGIALRGFTSSIPGGGTIVWGVGLGLLALAYLVAQRQFDRVEATPDRAR